MIPPYGKPLAQLISEQNSPLNDVYIFIGELAWEKAKNSSVMRPDQTLCLPPDKTPFHYEWPVAMCDILIFDTSETDEYLIHDLTTVLFQYQAVIVRYVSHTGKLTIFKRI